MYEWKNEVSAGAIKSKIHWLREEIKRISSSTLRGSFVNDEDREYWVKRLRALNSELSALEER